MNTATTTAFPIPESLAGRVDQMFPTLTPAQIERVEAHGHTRDITVGDVLFNAGDPSDKFFVVVRGQVELVRPADESEVQIRAYGPGQFNGEINMLSGRRVLGTARVAESGEVIELNRRELLALVQTDSELGEIIMRAFILRRMGLIANRVGDVVVMGSLHCGNTLRVKEFLTRNGHPYQYVNLDEETDVQDFLDRFHVREGDIPVVICRGDVVLRRPTNEQIADCLGFNDAIDMTQVRDVVVVGAGPAGLAAAVYAGSEGLDVLVLETTGPGGQAGASSKIENYMGFPNGISGQELSSRAFNQAQKFGAQFAIAKQAARLTCADTAYGIQIGNGAVIRSRTIVIATGAEYRRLPIENLKQYEGLGIYYAATFMESQVCGGEELIVVGGGNSAGQAAVFLAQKAKHVHLIVRSDGLAESMSRYLIRRIEEAPNITLYAQTELVGLEGTGHVECVHWRDNRTGSIETRPIRHVFLMTGAEPSTAWLDGCIALDEKGFVKTGPDLTTDDLVAAEWFPARSPYLLETNRPGIFAVGDVRAGNIKRVASAVGEGSIVVSLVHQALSEWESHSLAVVSARGIVPQEGNNDNADNAEPGNRGVHRR